MEEIMSDFFKFVEDNGSNFAIGQEFIKNLNDTNINKKILQGWFSGKGYDVSLQECQELINKKEFINAGVDSVKGY
jgi:hypothetical protein